MRNCVPRAIQRPARRPNARVFTLFGCDRHFAMNESLNQPPPADRPPLQTPPSSTSASASAAAAATEPPVADRAHEGSAITTAPSAGAQFLTVFPPIMVPMFLAVADQT